MNIKKSFLVALAGATAFATMSSFAVSAATPGYTDGSVTEQDSITIDIADDGSASASIELSKVTVDVELPAGIVDGDSIDFSAAIVTDLEAAAAVTEIDGLNAFEVLDLFFTDSDGNTVDMAGKNVKVVIKNTSFNKVFCFHDVLEAVDSKVTDAGLEFVAPHFSTYVLADISEEATSTPDDNTTSTPDNNTTSTPDNNTTSTPAGDATQTGDNGFTTTIAIFSIMAVVSLATAVVATKVKKAK